MKRSQALAISVLALLLLAAVPVQQARAQGTYSEKLSVYVAGNNALWYMTFDGINGSSKLAALEAVPGLSWYNVTAIDTAAWQSDFQIFGNGGYNLLPVPFAPSQAVFLSVGSDSFADASAAAGALDSYLLTNFVSYSNGTGTYTFYSPVTFTDIVPKTLLTFVPSHMGGFAAAITSSLTSTQSPMVVLEGKSSASGFAHTLLVGSITNKALNGAGAPQFLTYFGSTVTFLQASSKASSSTIQMRTLDGVVRSHDAAVVTNDTAQFSGSYSLSLASGKKVKALNATVLELPVQLLAYRTVNLGVLHTGQNLSVTVTLTDLSGSLGVTSISFSDDWWNSTGLFTLVSAKNSTTFPTTLAGGATITPVYVLRYTGTATEKLNIPASTVGYTFTIGATKFHGRTVLNPIRLSLGSGDAVVIAYVAPTGGFGKAVGGTQTFKVVVSNLGTEAASTVVVAGQPISGLGVNSSSTVTVTQSAAGFLGTNITHPYSVTYQDVAGNHLNATTNVISDIFSHTLMKVGLPTLILAEVLTPLSGGVVNLNLTFTTSNIGTVNVTSFAANGVLPSGIGCGKVKGTGITCTSGQVSLAYGSVVPMTPVAASIDFNVTTPQNFFVSPMSFSGVSAGHNLTGMSNGLGIPTGLAMAKQFAPSALFGGMTSKVDVTATNQGPFAIYNATVSSTADTFDTILSSAATSKTSHLVSPGQSLNFSYSVKATSSKGSLKSASVVARFYFAGSLFTTSALGPTILIYLPLNASITTSPANPIEGKPFTLKWTIDNPSGVAVSNVLLTLPLPSGLTLSQLQNATVAAGILSVEYSTMGASRTFTATAVGVASSGVAVPFDKATLTFSYGGVTINGKLPTQGIAIGEDVTTRYLVPTGLVLLALLATVFYLRRQTAVSVPVSQK